MILRSSVWNSSGELVSAGFKKFFNWGEKPELTFTPFSTKANGGINVLEKIDGSLLIVSMYKGNLIHRTRGTIDASNLDTGMEIFLLMEKYPKAFEFEVNEEGTANYSLLYEWVSPNNIIVMKYDNVDITLVGKINHEDYSMATQKELDEISSKIGVKRPNYFYFDSIKQMLTNVENFKGVEGVCVYCNHDQNIRKLKSEWYLSLHRMKSDLCSLEKVLDVYLSMDMPEYNTFYSLLSEVYDFEILKNAQPYISRCCDAWKQVKNITEGMINFVNEKVLTLNNRKEQADLIINSYGKKTNRSSYVFNILDKKELTKDAYKKLLFQVLKK